MGLQGNLEDLPLLDIIQIVSFSQKTGYLSIEMEGGDGAIVFVAGLVVSAFTANSPPADRRLATLAPEARQRALRSRLGFALEQLARVREGAFAFELTGDVPTTVGSRDIRIETLARGINPQELLLELAQGIDEDLVQSTAAVEASFAAPEEAVVAEESAVPAAAVETPPPLSARRPPGRPRRPRRRASHRPLLWRRACRPRRPGRLQRRRRRRNPRRRSRRRSTRSCSSTTSRTSARSSSGTSWPRATASRRQRTRSRR